MSMLGFGRIVRLGLSLERVARWALVLAALLVSLRLAAPHSHAKAHVAGADASCSVCATVAAPFVGVAEPAPLPERAATKQIAEAPIERAVDPGVFALHDSRGPPAQTQD
jgi:hypothetical protein